MGIMYQDGLNVDEKPFNPQKECQPGGLYFLSEDQLTNRDVYPLWPHWIREVTIPDRAKVYIEVGKFKADKLILAPRQRFYLDDVVNEETIVEVLSTDLSIVRYLRNKNVLTSEICNQAVKFNGANLEFVPPELITPDMCNQAVEIFTGAVNFVPNQFMTKKLCDMVTRTICGQNRAITTHEDPDGGPTKYHIAVGTNASMVPGKFSFAMGKSAGNEIDSVVLSASR